MRNSYVYGVSAIALAAFAAVAAPPATAAAQAGGSKASGLEEVVVVARRVEERLQDVPVTVTAITPQVLRQTQITTGTDLIKLVPTLNVQQGATGPNTNYALRGIRAGVVTYLNDIPTNTGSVDDQIWDLSSVQALAGPQGTLFGKSATGGAILFQTQRPTKTYGGFVDASYGKYNTQLLTGVVNLPVNEMIQLRLGARLDKHDGYVTNTIGEEMQSRNRRMFRASAMFEPTDYITDFMIFDYGKRDEKPVSLITSDQTQGGFAAAFYGQARVNFEQARQNAFGIRKIASPFESYNKTENYGFSNVFESGLGHGATFKYILGYRYSDSDDLSSKSGYTFPIEIGRGQVIDSRQWTHEFQLQGKTFDDRLSYTLGYFDSRLKAGSGSSYSLFGQEGLPFSDSRNITHFNLNKNTTKAEYGQLTFAITDKFNVTGGIRHTKDTAFSSATGQQPAFFFFGPQVCGLTPGAVGVNSAACVQNQSASSTATTYNVSLDYHVNENFLLYATTRKGYNGGGFNGGIPADAPAGAPQSAYEPEYVTDYEVGAKTEGHIGGVPVRANISVYDAKYTKIQRSSFGIAPSGPYAGIANGPSAEIKGVQLESVVRPFQDLTINLNYGYLHSEYTEGAPGFPKGNVFGQAPENTLNVSANYHHDLAEGGAMIASLSYAYQSEITFMDSNVGLLNTIQKAYGILDGQVGWESIKGSPVDLTFFMKNITDEAYALEKQDQTNLLGFTGTVYNDPRTYGVSVHYHFGG